MVYGYIRVSQDKGRNIAEKRVYLRGRVELILYL